MGGRQPREVDGQPQEVRTPTPPLEVQEQMLVRNRGAHSEERQRQLSSCSLLALENTALGDLAAWGMMRCSSGVR